MAALASCINQIPGSADFGLGWSATVGHIAVMNDKIDLNEPITEQADDLQGLRVGLRALSRMAEAAPLDLARLAGACAVDVALAGQIVTVFEEMGYVCKLPFDAQYTLTAAGRALADCFPGQRCTEMMH